jgi:cytochrome bd-type quinol oxidase subunit 2
MQQALNQLGQILQQVITALIKFIGFVWSWSFGQIITIFQSDWQSLPIWKIVVLVLIVLAIIYVLYKAAVELWGAAEAILKAFIALLGVLVSILPYVLVAGVIAAGGGWVIQNVNV